MKPESLTPPPSLSALLVLEVINRVRGVFSSAQVKELPRRVGPYIMVQPLVKVGTANAFALGLYEHTKTKKRAIGKLWTGTVKTFDYYALKNEITMYELLHRALRRTEKKLPKRLQAVQLPAVLSVAETEHTLLLLLEFKEGAITNDLSTATKLDAYWKTTEYISYLGAHLTPEEMRYVPKRQARHFIFLYPQLLVCALATHPRAYRQLLAGIPVLLKSLPSLLASRAYAVVHRDLHFKNILVSGREYILIDLQLCAYTLKLYELVTTLRYRWGEDDLHRQLLAQIQAYQSGVKHFDALFAGLCVLSATHGLTGGHFPKQKIDYWIDFLDFAVTYPHNT